MARSVASRMATGTVTDRAGRYTLPLPPGADVRVRPGRPGVDRPDTRFGAGPARDSTSPRPRRPARRGSTPARAGSALLPESDAKRKFILDCTGCHQFNESRALQDGAPRGRPPNGRWMWRACWATRAPRRIFPSSRRTAIPIPPARSSTPRCAANLARLDTPAAADAPAVGPSSPSTTCRSPRTCPTTWRSTRPARS